MIINYGLFIRITISFRTIQPRIHSHALVYMEFDEDLIKMREVGLDDL